jgi:hypothetical protein
MPEITGKEKWLGNKTRAAITQTYNLVSEKP